MCACASHVSTPVYVYMCWGGLKLTSCVFFNCSSMYLWRKNLTLNLYSLILLSTGLRSQLALGSPVSTLTTWGYRLRPAALYVVLGTQLPILNICKVSGPLSHLPNLMLLIFKRSEICYFF